MADRASILVFPHDDVAFRAHVEAAHEARGYWHGPSIEADIRQAYPAAVVRRSHPLAAIVPGTSTWYVYRDGAATPGQESGEWWLDEGLPEALVDGKGAYLSANDALANLFGVPTERIVGAGAGSFTRHEPDAELGRRLFSALAETGSLHSTAVVTRPDGEEWPIEFHMRRASEPGQYLVVMRRIQPRGEPQRSAVERALSSDAS
jgi:PAS domain S-box-containing protein